MRYHPLAAARIINSCAVLHNFLIDRGMPGQEFDVEIEEPEDDLGNIGPNEYVEQGRQVRDSIVRYFNENY